MIFQGWGIDFQTENRSKIDEKMPSKMECLNFRLFCCENQAQDAPKTSPRRPQDAPKTPPRRPKTPPRRLKKGSGKVPLSRWRLKCLLEANLGRTMVLLEANLGPQVGPLRPTWAPKRASWRPTWAPRRGDASTRSIPGGFVVRSRRTSKSMRVHTFLHGFGGCLSSCSSS